MKTTTKTNLFSYIFTNLVTGEFRQVMLKLNRNSDGCFQVSTEDGKTWADDAETPNEAIENGAWIDLPKQWGWKDVKRTLPLKS